MDLYCILHKQHMVKETFKQSGNKFYEVWVCPGKRCRIRITHDANGVDI